MRRWSALSFSEREPKDLLAIKQHMHQPGHGTGQVRKGNRSRHIFSSTCSHAWRRFFFKKNPISRFDDLADLDAFMSVRGEWFGRTIQYYNKNSIADKY